MSTTIGSSEGTPKAPAVASMLIDADIHESAASIDVLKPYLPRVWQQQLEVSRPTPALRTSGTWIRPLRDGGTRSDWVVPGVPMGTDLDVMRHQLFDNEGVTIGILNGDPRFQVSTADGGYEFWTALASAYNDWQIEHWLDPEPRLRGSVHVVAHDPQAAAREIDRVAQHPQVVQVLLPTVNDRAYGDPLYRPIFEAAVRNDLVVALHHGQATKTALGYTRYYIEWHTLAAPQASFSQLVSIICNGTFDLLPELKLIILETGVAWLPWLMWRLDQQYRETRSEVPWLKRLPSEHIRDNVRVATQPLGDVTTEQFVQLMEMADTDRVFIFATDYPHYDADSPEAVLLRGISEESQRRIRYQNAIETYPRLKGLGEEASL